MILLLALTTLPVWFGGSAVAATDGEVGDVFVATDGEPGGRIFLDGAVTGIVAPGVVRGVPVGAHTVRVDAGCRTGTADVTVRTNAVERLTVPLAVGEGTVSVTSNPPETVVTEGGKELGKGTFGPIPLACGAHTLVGTAPGRQTLPYTVEVPLRGHADVAFDLPLAALGGIAITPTPYEAHVFVDGIARGDGPMTVEGLPGGVHVVVAELDGYLPKEVEVTVVPYQIVRTTLELDRKPPPKTFSQRLGLDRVRWGRVGVDIGVSALALGVGGLAWWQYGAAVDAYGDYQGLTYADDPEGFYAREVEAPRTRAYVLAGAAGATAVGAGVLWATTTPKPVPAGAQVGARDADAAAPPDAPSLELRLGASPTGVVLSGRF